jgi:hypothetical protein
MRTTLETTTLKEQARKEFIDASGVTAVTGAWLYEKLASKGLVYLHCVAILPFVKFYFCIQFIFF